MTIKTNEKPRTVLKPFVVAYAEDATKPTKLAGKHLGKDSATKEVLNRIVKRVKKI